MRERRTISVREEALKARFEAVRQEDDNEVLRDIYEKMFELSCDLLVNQNEIVSWNKSEPDADDRQQGWDYWLADTRGVVPLAVVSQKRGIKDFKKKYSGVMVVGVKTRQGNLRTAASMAKSIRRSMGEYRGDFFS